MTKPDGFPQRRQRWQRFTNISLQELIEWSWSVDQPYTDVRLTHVNVKYVADESDEERVAREAREAEQRERQERWERETLARLKAKYEPESPETLR